jgi:hypothetical protein
VGGCGQGGSEDALCVEDGFLKRVVGEKKTSPERCKGLASRIVSQRLKEGINSSFS